MSWITLVISCLSRLLCHRESRQLIAFLASPLPLVSSQVRAAALQQPTAKPCKADPMLHSYCPSTAKSSPVPSNMGQPVRPQNPPGSATAAGASTELAPPNTLCPPFEESALAAAQKNGLNPEVCLHAWRESVGSSTWVLLLHVASSLAQPDATLWLQGTLGQFLTSITEEERRLIETEGVPVPLSGALTAHQNKELKRMRRKVKVRQRGCGRGWRTRRAVVICCQLLSHPVLSGVEQALGQGQPAPAQGVSVAARTGERRAQGSAGRGSPVPA